MNHSGNNLESWVIVLIARHMLFITNIIIKHDIGFVDPTVANSIWRSNGTNGGKSNKTHDGKRSEKMRTEVKEYCDKITNALQRKCWNSHYSARGRQRQQSQQLLTTLFIILIVHIDFNPMTLLIILLLIDAAQFQSVPVPSLLPDTVCCVLFKEYILVCSHSVILLDLACSVPHSWKDA